MTLTQFTVVVVKHRMLTKVLLMKIYKTQLGKPLDNFLQAALAKQGIASKGNNSAVPKPEQRTKPERTSLLMQYNTNSQIHQAAVERIGVTLTESNDIAVCYCVPFQTSQNVVYKHRTIILHQPVIQGETLLHVLLANTKSTISIHPAM